MSQVLHSSFVVPNHPTLRNIYTRNVGRENITCTQYGEFDKHIEISHHPEYMMLIQYGAVGSQINTGMFKHDKKAHYGTMHE